MTLIEAMRRRRSVRRYQPEPLSAALRQAVERIITDPPPGPAGGRPRLMLLSLSREEAERPLRLATYGTIRGASAFVAGAIGRGPHAHLDFGFSLERVILELTRLGLGTCWLGGIFRRRSFARRIHLRPEEELPAVTPVGRPSESSDPASRAMAGMVRARTRKPWHALFFLERPGIPLDPESIGAYRQVLECVRIGPSASNRQPWRIVREAESNSYHLFLRRTPGYRHATATDLQRLDMGIAMCHFSCAAGELGLRGQWRLAETPGAQPPGNAAREYAGAPGMEWVATWRARD